MQRRDLQKRKETLKQSKQPLKASFKNTQLRKKQKSRKSEEWPRLGISKSMAGSFRLINSVFTADTLVEIFWDRRKRKEKKRKRKDKMAALHVMHCHADILPDTPGIQETTTTARYVGYNNYFHVSQFSLV